MFVSFLLFPLFVNKTGDSSYFKELKLLTIDNSGSNRVALKNGKQRHQDIPTETVDDEDWRVAMVLCLLRTILLQASRASEANAVQTCS